MKGRNGSSSIGCRKPPPHAARALDEHVLRPSASVDALQCQSCVGSCEPRALTRGVLAPAKTASCNGEAAWRKNSWERGFPLPALKCTSLRHLEAHWFEPAMPLCLTRAGRPQGNGSDILGELPGVGRFDTVLPQRACDPAAQLCQQLEANAGSVSRAVYFADVAKELTAGGPIVYVYLYIGCPGIF